MGVAVFVAVTNGAGFFVFVKVAIAVPPTSIEVGVGLGEAETTQVGCDVTFAGVGVVIVELTEGSDAVFPEWVELSSKVGTGVSKELSNVANLNWICSSLSP